MALAGAAGWCGGHWKGRDAAEILARHKAQGEQADATLVQVKTRFGTDLAAEEAGFDAGIETPAETHTRQILACDAKVVCSAEEIVRLSRVSVACQARIAGLIAQRLRLRPRPCPMAPASSH